MLAIFTLSQYYVDWLDSSQAISRLTSLLYRHVHLLFFSQGYKVSMNTK
jgi:hypothetical protein